MSESGEPKIDVVRLASTKVFIAPGQQLKLEQLWLKQTAVFIFLRHFACIACRAHAAQVWKDREKYERSGAKIVFVGNGQPHFIEKFREDLNLQNAVILTDPSLLSFQAAGFKRGFLNLVQPKSVINAVKLASQGYSQTSYSNDAGTHWQMGGILVINPAGKVMYHYISESLGDFPEEENLPIIQKDEKTKTSPA